MDNTIIIIMIAVIAVVCLSLSSSIGGGLYYNSTLSVSSTSVPASVPENTVNTDTNSVPTLPEYRHLCNDWNKCLTVDSNSPNKGQFLNQWDKVDENGQLWRFDVDVQNNVGDKGARIQQAEYGDIKGQRWHWE